MRFMGKLCPILTVQVKRIWCIELHKKLHYPPVSNFLAGGHRRDMRIFKFRRFYFTAISSVSLRPIFILTPTLYAQD